MTVPGRSGPRTQLAWDRSALSAAALGALLLKLGVEHDVGVEIVAGAVALLLSATLALGVRRQRLPTHETGPRASSGRSLAVVAVLTSSTAALTLIALVVIAA
jgi:uncharacterized membrane protein YidH (DUF202 family)